MKTSVTIPYLLSRPISDEYPAVKSIVVSIAGKSWKDTIYICDIKELAGISLEENVREDHKTDITVESEIDLITTGVITRRIRV